mgnify:FL=1
MTNATPITYNEMYIKGNQFFVTYKKGQGTETNLIQIIDTRFSNTGRISAKIINWATGNQFWTSAKDVSTECKNLNITGGYLTLDWKFDGRV